MSLTVMVPPPIPPPNTEDVRRAEAPNADACAHGHGEHYGKNIHIHTYTETHQPPTCTSLTTSLGTHPLALGCSLTPAWVSDTGVRKGVTDLVSQLPELIRECRTPRKVGGNRRQ
jgi:hypothetical protein